MTENQWRAKLVGCFRQAFPDGFIWVNDVRYKAGFPDLYIVLRGTARHYELKLCRKNKYVNQMTQLQMEVCKRIAQAGIYVACITYVPALNNVHVLNFINNVTPEYNIEYKKFLEIWSSSHLV